MSWTEPGRHVADDGRIVYSWPAEGRFAALWERVVVAFPDETERCEAIALLHRWRDESSTLLAYMDTDDGVWHDCEPDWDHVTGWLNG